MAPSLALLLTIGFIVALFIRDAARREPVSGALWIPVLWMAITGSRFVSQWLNLANPSYRGSVSEGSPLDAAYFMVLIIAALVVLTRRKVKVGELLRSNAWLAAFALYAFMSILWSDFPIIAIKRWIKTLGHPVMALIILSDPDPERAFRTVMRRCAYVLLPMSVLFIKYFPQYGRGFDQWTGSPYNRGIGLTKNDLGYVCMISGLFFVWNLITASRVADTAARRWELALCVGFLTMASWLLISADSATSLAAAVLGATTLVALRTRLVNVRLLGSYFIIAVLIITIAEQTLDLYARTITLLGRDTNLTDRTEVWADAIALQPNVLFGAGFESFWLGYRLETLWAKWWWRPNQAHNGYIETYLNLGMVGLLLLIGVIVAVFRKIKRQLSDDAHKEFAQLRLALLLAILAFNYTEAAFKGVHLIWTIFHIVALDYSTARQVVAKVERPRRTISRAALPRRPKASRRHAV